MLVKIVEFYHIDVLKKMINNKTQIIETAIDQIALSKLFDNIKAIHYGQEEVDKRLKEFERELYEEYRKDKLAMR